MTTDRRALSLAIGLLIGGLSMMAAPTTAKADHCFMTSNQIIYCYDSLPGHVVHQIWQADSIPPLPAGQIWECNLMSHPRTICVSFEDGGEPPIIPKYTPGSRDFETKGPGPDQFAERPPPVLTHEGDQ